MKRTPLARRTPVRKRNAKRHAANWTRAYGSPERVEFVKTLPCACCAWPAPSVNAHIMTGGKGRKADARFIVPLCNACHDWQHEYGWMSLAFLNTLDKREAAAVATERAWQAHRDRP